MDLSHPNPWAASASTHRPCPQLSGRSSRSPGKAGTRARCVPRQSANVQVWQDGLTPHKQVQDPSHHRRACVRIHLHAAQLQRPSMSARMACRGESACTAANKAQLWAILQAISLKKVCLALLASDWTTGLHRRTGHCQCRLTCMQPQAGRQHVYSRADGSPCSWSPQ